MRFAKSRPLLAIDGYFPGPDYSNNFPDPSNDFIATPFDIGRDIKSTHQSRILSEVLKDKTDSFIEIYTDGSKPRGANSVGAACYSPQENIRISKSINPLASIYTAVCIALNEAMDLALQRNEKNVFIFTDSLSALQALKHPQLNVKTNNFLLEIRRKFNEFNSPNLTNREITFCWIPSHTGITGNETVDLLAKTATDAVQHDFPKIPFTELNEVFKTAAKENTVKQATDLSTSKGSNYFAMFHKSTTKPWFHKFKFRRKTIVWINRVRANHYNISVSLNRIGVKDSAMCPCGHSKEDIDNLVPSFLSKCQDSIVIESPVNQTRISSNTYAISCICL
ncbi:uncharacterized protein LOC135167949 [Diachasmimorpha longicaudata]|uniref:uncharacterized protein LOC135167949 n=1 Tax=Diachasmimorpha longicaudata TaxID=58733 RepID=UPI0030B8A9C3